MVLVSVILGAGRSPQHESNPPASAPASDSTGAAHRARTQLYPRVCTKSQDVEVEVDVDSYFGCLQGVPKSAEVLFPWYRSILGTDFDNSEIASPVIPHTESPCSKVSCSELRGSRCEGLGCEKVLESGHLPN